MTVSATECKMASSTPKSEEASTSSKWAKMTDDALAGACAGFIARMLTAPFDVVKIRQQLSKSTVPVASTSLLQSFRSIVQEEGWSALWKGNLSATFLWVTYALVQFGLYGTAKTYIELQNRRDEESRGYQVKQSAWKRAFCMFLAGAGAGTAATIATYPFDIMRTQFALQGKNKIHATIPSFIQHTWSHYGLKGFYSGIGPAVIGVTPYIGLNFAIYETLKKFNEDLDKIDRIAKNVVDKEKTTGGKVLSLLKTGLIGGVSGGASKFLIYPLDTVKKRLQAQTLETDLVNVVTKNPLYTGMGECFTTVYRQEGIMGFYKGIIPTIAKAVTSAAITFMAYEGAKMMLQSSRNEKNIESGIKY